MANILHRTGGKLTGWKVNPTGKHSYVKANAFIYVIFSCENNFSLTFLY
jgi:hypothetical protein